MIKKNLPVPAKTADLLRRDTAEFHGRLMDKTRKGVRHDDPARHIDVIRINKDWIGVELLYKPTFHLKSFGITDDGARTLIKMLSRVLRGGKLQRWKEPNWQITRVVGPAMKSRKRGRLVG